MPTIHCPKDATPEEKEAAVDAILNASGKLTQKQREALAEFEKKWPMAIHRRIEEACLDAAARAQKAHRCPDRFSGDEALSRKIEACITLEPVIGRQKALEHALLACAQDLRHVCQLARDPLMSLAVGSMPQSSYDEDDY